eukprot:231193-Chlamydomonas_euryale.AAC.2
MAHTYAWFACTAALTLDANFRAPVIREYCLLHGLRSAGRRSIRNILGSVRAWAFAWREDGGGRGAGASG